jgi:hypothetical protein
MRQRKKNGGWLGELHWSDLMILVVIFAIMLLLLL